MGIEPTLSAWEAEVLPLNYTRRIRYATQLIYELQCLFLGCGNEYTTISNAFD